ncbi:flagellin [Brevundimonas sp. GN22]|uniref:flagellin n=1 Tax=Brevundimonas pishanensis TaxID=2896315 RepID=UPI001FA7D9BD|nr:flagellin [Brevundimonas pishanensis]
MTTSVHTNSSALIALQNLNSTNSKLGAVQNRVSTGLKVQGAKDNAATWAIAQNQRADTSSLEAVKTSLNRATSIADVALAAGSQISDIITELKQKAVAASDPSASDASKKAYNDEFQTLVASLTSFAKNATFDGKNILDNSLTADLEFIASADGGETIALTPQALDADALGLSGLDLTTDPATALTAVTDALATSSEKLAELGAQAKQIERHTTFVGKLMDSLEVGVGNLVDADLAKESARLQALQVQQQLGTSALSIANQAPQSILSLFQG